MKEKIFGHKVKVAIENDRTCIKGIGKNVIMNKLSVVCDMDTFREILENCCDCEKFKEQKSNKKD